MEGWGCDRVSIPDGWPGFDPAVKGCGADGGWVSIPMGFEPDSWVSIPRVRTRLLGFRSLGFEPDSWGFDPDGVRTRLLGFDP